MTQQTDTASPTPAIQALTAEDLASLLSRGDIAEIQARADLIAGPISKLGKKEPQLREPQKRRLAELLAERDELVARLAAPTAEAPVETPVAETPVIEIPPVATPAEIPAAEPPVAAAPAEEDDELVALLARVERIRQARTEKTVEAWAPKIAAARDAVRARHAAEIAEMKARHVAEMAEAVARVEAERDAAVAAATLVGGAGVAGAGAGATKAKTPTEGKGRGRPKKTAEALAAKIPALESAVRAAQEAVDAAPGDVDAAKVLKNAKARLGTANAKMKKAQEAEASAGPVQTELRAAAE